MKEQYLLKGNCLYQHCGTVFFAIDTPFVLEDGREEFLLFKHGTISGTSDRGNKTHGENLHNKHRQIIKVL